jgi:hypothetical protein
VCRTGAERSTRPPPNGRATMPCERRELRVKVGGVSPM